MSDLRTVLRDLGAVCIMIGAISLITLLVPLYFGELPGSTIDGVTPILITSAVFFLIGIPFYLFFKQADPTNFKCAMVTAALGWLLVSVIGSFPFLLMPYNTQSFAVMDSLSAFFESMSGWTGTGLTMVEKESLLPFTLQFWRTFIQWIGGVGVIVLTLSILARPGTGSFVLYKGEARDQKTHPSIISTVRTIWWIFLLYTIIGIIALTIAGWLSSGNGMDPWQSLNHAMTGIATGGFSVTDDSLASFDGISQFIVILLMVLGSIAFAVHYDLLKGRFKRFLKDIQLHSMLLLFIIGILALTMLNMYIIPSFPSLREAFAPSAFQFISALSCTGFSSVESLGSWSESSLLLLSFAMIIGGAAGSTAGGIKLFRLNLLFKGVGWRMKQAVSTPKRVFVHKLGEKPLSKESAMDLINEAAIISFFWITILAVSIMILSSIYSNQSLGKVIFEVCSAQGNVGLSSGITSISMNSTAKAMLILNMWIGRLEIIPVIILIRSLFGIKRNLI
ncbi:MAG: TrkH family potassium uptake protein [Candidatus Thermoplasmatota archaeon]|nr:TrkH family potassium uptake protein [Candidatus Thermoplasmatota archaeon]